MRRPGVDGSAGVCPTNGRAGRAVDSLTLKAQLAVPLTELTAGEYFFCPAADCPTVYYRADGRQRFDEADLREAVFQKHPGAEDVWVCYCFRHNVAGIRSELFQTGSSTVVEQIAAGIRAGQCACDIRNPQGDCCLGNVRKVVQRLKSELSL